MRRSTLGLLASLTLIAPAASVAAARSDPTQIELTQQIRFTTPEGQTSAASASSWRVEAVGNETLRLVPEDGEAVDVEARAVSHTEELEGPVAIATEAGAGTQHVLLLLPDGTGFEAVGFTGAVTPRGAAPGLEPERLKAAVATRGVSRPSSRAAALTKTGRWFFQQRTDWAHRRAIRYFEGALKANPDHAPAEAGLADSYALRYLHVQPKPEYLARAKQHAERAVKLAPQSSSAHASLGWVKNIELDLSGARQELELALKYDPRNDLARQWYAETLMKSGEVDESLTQIAKAASQAPNSGVRQAIASRLNQVARRYDVAIRHGARAQRLNRDLPGFFRMSLAYSYWATNQQPQAIEALLRDPTLPPAQTTALRGVGEQQGLRAMVGAMFAAEPPQNGRPCGSVASIGATVLAFLEQTEQSLDCLELSVREGAPPSYWKLDPILDPIRMDPRFTKMLEQRARR